MIKNTFAALIFLSAVLLAQDSPQIFKLTGSESNGRQLGNTILDFAVDGETLWMGTSRGLSKSTDGGKSWTNYYGNEVFGDESVTAIGVYDGVVYASTGHTVNTNGQDLPEGSGLNYSTDGGNTWISTSQPLDEPGDSSVRYGVNTLRALPVTTKINNITYDVAFTPGTIWVALFAGGLRKSTDMGETWQRVVLPPDNLNMIHPDSSYSFALQPVAGRFGSESYLNHRVFSVTAADDTTIYAGTAAGINKGIIDPETGDITWYNYNSSNQDEAISGNFVTAMAYSKTSGSLWAATWRAEGANEFYGVSATFDEGETWRTFLEGERAHNFGFVSYPAPGGGFYTDVIAATDDGAFRTSNFGNTWIANPTIKDEYSNIRISDNQFYAAASMDFEGRKLVFLGTAGEGLVKLSEDNRGWNGQWEILLAYSDLASVKESYAFPNPFSPRQEYTRIVYSAGGKSADVTIRIFDFGMNLVRTLIQNVPKDINGEHIEIWDGRDESMEYVPNGVYFYRIDIGSDEPVFGKIMVLK